MNDHPAIGVAQSCATAGATGANAAQHLRLTELAATEGAQVLVFPELSLTGYEIDLAPSLAYQPRDTRLRPLSEAAMRWRITLLVGAPVALGTDLHIGTFILRPDGGVDIYTKRRLGAFSDSASVDGRLPPAETSVFQPGSLDPLVTLGDHSAAPAICADTGDSNHPGHAAARGASIYLASMFVIPSEYDADAARLRSYTAAHGMIVALANHGAATGGLNAAGRSAIWDATGERVVELPAAGAGVAVAAASAEGWRTAVRLDRWRQTGHYSVP